MGNTFRYSITVYWLISRRRRPGKVFTRLSSAKALIRPAPTGPNYCFPGKRMRRCATLRTKPLKSPWRAIRMRLVMLLQANYRDVLDRLAAARANAALVAKPENKETTAGKNLAF